MAEHVNEGQNLLGKLSTPSRNRYFYGKLLDAHHFEMEQQYFNRKRWLLNRLIVGSGVVCGLPVVPTGNGKCLQIGAGVALDRLGREIIVPEASRAFDPRELTDACGQPAGERLEGEGVVTLCLAYHECESEPVPVLVSDCETKLDCAPSTVLERYKILIWEGAAQPIEPACGLPDLFTPPDGSEIHRRLVERASKACPEVEGPACVVLATVKLPAEGEAIADDMIDTSARPVVHTHELLFELLLCLAERVEQCCQSLILRYVSGDAQQGEPDAWLEELLVVEVVGGDGQTVPGEEVTFRVRGGGGAVEPASVNSDNSGRATTKWRLGPEAGLNTAEATIGSGSTVAFHALARGEGDGEVTLPVVVAIWPPNARQLTPDDPEGAKWLEMWKEQPGLEITFDRKMREDQLVDEDLMKQWLRVWQITDHGEILVRPLKLVFREMVDEPILGVEGFTVAYDLEVEEPGAYARYLVQIYAEADNIVDLSEPPLLLDAEFAGTKLSTEHLQRLWELDGEEWFTPEVWEALVDTGATLPSGDGAEGGRFHSWFEIGPEQ
jgi:hypothetical protein